MANDQWIQKMSNEELKAKQLEEKDIEKEEKQIDTEATLAEKAAFDQEI